MCDKAVKMMCDKAVKMDELTEAIRLQGIATKHTLRIQTYTTLKYIVRMVFEEGQVDSAWFKHERAFLEAWRLIKRSSLPFLWSKEKRVTHRRYLSIDEAIEHKIKRKHIGMEGQRPFVPVYQDYTLIWLMTADEFKKYKSAMGYIEYRLAERRADEDLRSC